jgi:hypothetical protein
MTAACIDHGATNASYLRDVEAQQTIDSFSDGCRMGCWDAIEGEAA